ncbi:MAG: peptidoglycan-binding protein [Nitrosopumilus sp.]|nr:peptidoglycan-binding protein [Nitrosopumilus sp.]MBA3550657.1 peptidoglycan-binding protein [Patescibacteria group bacterium]
MKKALRMFFGSIAIAVMAIGIISIVEEQTIISIINSSNQSAAVTASVESSGCIQITKILQLGSTDATSSGQVTKLQRFLQERAYLPYSSQTGSYNTLTKQAVAAFERAQGISPDGIVGLVTAEKIKQISCSNIGTETPNPSNYSVRVASTSVLPRGPVTITWTSPATANIFKDWIALYRVGAANSTYSMWKYTTGVSGTMTLLAPQTAGTYELRYLKNNGYTSVAKSAQFVVGNGTTVTPSPSNYTVQVAKSSVIPGGQIDISWTSPSTANIVKDWIALYEVGAMNATYGPWHYTSGSSGTMVLSAPQKAGSYEVRYLKNNTFTSVAKSAQFRIGSGSTPSEIPTPPQNPPSTPSTGWTTFNASSDTRKIYVSSSQGNDSNDGLSTNNPVETLNKARSLLRNGYPDWLLLKKGDVWNNESLSSWKISGRSAMERMVIMSYGTGSRPRIESGTNSGFTTSGSVVVNNIAVIGIHFKGSNKYYGIHGNAAGSHSLYEDVVVENYSDGVAFTGNSGTISNIVFRRSHIIDTDNDTSKSNGFYASKTVNLTIEENIFDHNGWSSPNRSDGTVFSHNVYIAYNNDNVIVQRNIISNAASHGLQMRPGGIVRDNLFVRNPINMNFGSVSGVTIRAGGVIGSITGNVILEANDINSSAPRGWGIDISNTKPGGNVVVSGNLLAFNISRGNGPAFSFPVPSPSNPQDAVGVNNVIIDGNIVYDWKRSVELSRRLIPGGTGITAFNYVTFKNNQFQSMQNEEIINHLMKVNSKYVTWQNNTYYNSSDQSKWFDVNDVSIGVSGWKNTVEPTMQISKKSYDVRTLGKYNSSIGGTNSTEAFITRARQQSRDNWDARYTASAANAYIKAGFFK